MGHGGIATVWILHLRRWVETIVQEAKMPQIIAKLKLVVDSLHQQKLPASNALVGLFNC
jgi:hypothetical protein